MMHRERGRIFAFFKELIQHNHNFLNENFSIQFIGGLLQFNP